MDHPIVALSGGQLDFQELIISDLAFIQTQIDKAAQLGNNVGLDEFDSNTISRIFAKGKAFCVKQAGEPVGVVLLEPSPLGRHLLPLVGYFHIVLSCGKMGEQRKLYRQLVEFAVQQTIATGRGYLGIMTSLFAPCVEWYEVLRALRFTISATLPGAGELKDHGDTDNYFLFREFYGDEINGKRATKEEIVQEAERICRSFPHSSVDKSVIQPPPNLKTPIVVGGILIRPAKREDGPIIYEWLEEAIEKNLSFTDQQFPTYEYFYHIRFTKMQWFVLEDDQGEMVMVTGVFRTPLTRSLHTKYTMGQMIANPTLRGKSALNTIGILQMIGTVTFFDSAGQMDTILMTASPIFKMMKMESDHLTRQLIYVGFIPYVGLVQGKPTDSRVISYIANPHTKQMLDEVLDISEMPSTHSKM